MRAEAKVSFDIITEAYNFTEGHDTPESKVCVWYLTSGWMKSALRFASLPHFSVQMCEESQPPSVQKQASVDTFKWSNRKEDYELLDVIGIYISGEY